MYASYCAQWSTQQLITPSENTSLKTTTPAGDSNTTYEMVVGKSNTYQHTFLIVAGSLLALPVLIAGAGTIGGQYLQLLSHEIAKGAMALADYQVDSANLELTEDIFVLADNSKNDEGEIWNGIKDLIWSSFRLIYLYL